MTKIIELMNQKKSYNELIDNQIHTLVMDMMMTTLDELYIEYGKFADVGIMFEICDVSFQLYHFKGEYQIKFGVHNMIQDINILNHEAGASDRVGTGLEDYYLKSLIIEGIKRVVPRWTIED